MHFLKALTLFLSSFLITNCSSESNLKQGTKSNDLTADSRIFGTWSDNPEGLVGGGPNTIPIKNQPFLKLSRSRAEFGVRCYVNDERKPTAIAYFTRSVAEITATSIELGPPERTNARLKVQMNLPGGRYADCLVGINDSQKPVTVRFKYNEINDTLSIIDTNTVLYKRLPDAVP